MAPSMMDQDTRRKSSTPRRLAQQRDIREGESFVKEHACDDQRTSRRQTRSQENLFTRIVQEAGKRYRWAGRRWRRIVREKRAHRFPESNRLVVEMVLFGWSMLPMLLGCLQEQISRQRRKVTHRINGLLTKLEKRRKLHPLVFLGSGCAAAAVLFFFSSYTMGTQVLYDGQVIATMASEKEAESIRSDLEQMTTRTLGETFTIDDSLIQYSTTLMPRQSIEDEEVLEEELSEEIGLVTSAYCLYINGERIGATPYEGALEELLEQLQAAATDENTISCSFAEEVDIRQEYVPTDEIVNLGYIAELLYSTKTAEVTYEVQKGDTWSQIAQDHGLTSNELLALNPGYDINKLQIGEILTMSASVPYLTMTVVQQ